VAAGLALLRAGTRSGSDVEETGDGAAKLRGISRASSIGNHDKVRLRWHDKGILHIRDRCAQTAYSAIAQIVQAQVCWIVSAQICGALDIARASERSVDRDSKARRRNGIISEAKRLEKPRPWRADSSGAAFPTAAARLTISPHPVSLRRVRRGQHAWRDRLVGTARAAWHGI